jgi:hypothetical protein
MDLSQLNWLKNVKAQSSERQWAYELNDMSIREAKIFCLNWRSIRDIENAKKPLKGDLMLLLQQAKVTHIVEFLDHEVYKRGQSYWDLYRVVKAIWMPPDGLDWNHLPHQREIFGFDYVVGNGSAHSLVDKSKMPQFHQHWELPTFQNHLVEVLTQISI